MPSGTSAREREPSCAFISSIRATFRSAWPSSPRAGCTCSPPPRRCSWGDPILCDETLDPFDPSTIQPGDIVGIGIHTGNALRGYEVGRDARARGASVVFGGIHATLYPDEAHELGGAHAVVKGDGDAIWATVIADCAAGQPQPRLRRRTHRRRVLHARAMGSAAARPLHVGLDSDRARLPEALLVLLGVADRRPGAAHARRRLGRRANRRTAAPRLPVHRAGRRQLLSGVAGRSRTGATPAAIRRACASWKRSAPSDSS